MARPAPIPRLIAAFPSPRAPLGEGGNLPRNISNGVRGNDETALAGRLINDDEGAAVVRQRDASAKNEEFWHIASPFPLIFTLLYPLTY